MLFEDCLILFVIREEMWALYVQLVESHWNEAKDTAIHNHNSTASSLQPGFHYHQDRKCVRLPEVGHI